MYTEVLMTDPTKTVNGPYVHALIAFQALALKKGVLQNSLAFYGWNAQDNLENGALSVLTKV